METNEDTDKQHKNKFDWLKAYQWQKGQSGNPAGRPKGRSMKEFTRDFLESLSDEDKLLFLQNLTPEMINAWRMGEGNAQTDVTSAGEKIMPTPILGGITNEVHTNNSIEEDTSPKEAS